MTTREMVIADFQERVRMNPDIPDDLKQALKTNDRVPMFVDNLVAEISRFDRLPKKVNVDRMKLKDLVYSMTDFFCFALKKYKDEQGMSDIQKLMHKAEANRGFTLDNQGNGYIEELGVEVRDAKRSSQEGS